MFADSEILSSLGAFFSRLPDVAEIPGAALRSQVAQLAVQPESSVWAKVNGALEILAGSGSVAGLTGDTTVSFAIFLVVTILGLALWRALFVRKVQTLKISARGPKLVAVFAIVVLVSGFGGWSWYAPLASASVAPGIVSPDGNRKTIQHFEGGIVKSILVREGDNVLAGEELLILEDTRAQSELDELIRRRDFLSISESRLLAERNQVEWFSVPDQAVDLAKPEVRGQIDSHSRLLKSRISALSNREDILLSRVSQLEDQIAGIENATDAQDEQISIISEEIAAAQTLLDRGLERMSRLLSLKRVRAEIRADLALQRAQIAENKKQIGETRLQIISMHEDWAERVDDELVSIRRMLAEIEGQIPTRLDRLARTVIRAPIDGSIMNVAVTTESGVVNAGQPLMEIVPTDGKLVVEARVRPTDIDRVKVPMKARLIFTAFKQRNSAPVYGTLQSISADVVFSADGSEPYYLAKVMANREELESAGIALVPGMPTEVMLLDEERTFLSYIAQPIADSFASSFLEE